MFKLEYLLFCAGKSVDDYGNLSLHGIFDKIYSSGFPTQHRPFSMVFRLRPSVVKKNGKIKVDASLRFGGKEIAGVKFDGQYSIEKEGDGVILAFDMSQLWFPQEGEYEIRLKVNNKTVGSKEFEVIKLEAPLGVIS